MLLVRRHLALGVEYDTLFHEELGGTNRTLHVSRGMNFNEAMGPNITVEFPATDDQRPDFDFGLHIGTVTKDQHVFAEDLTSKSPVYAYSALKIQVSFVLRSAPEQGIDFAEACEVCSIHPVPL